MGPITSLSLVFVRNNLPMPDASILPERDAWQLQVSGLPNPRKISIAALKRLPSAPSPSECKAMATVENFTATVRPAPNGLPALRDAPCGLECRSLASSRH